MTITSSAIPNFVRISRLRVGKFSVTMNGHLLKELMLSFVGVCCVFLQIHGTSYLRKTRTSTNVWGP